MLNDDFESLRAYQKERHDVSRVFLFDFSTGFGGPCPFRVQMPGENKFALGQEPARSTARYCFFGEIEAVRSDVEGAVLQGKERRKFGGLVSMDQPDGGVGKNVAGVALENERLAVVVFIDQGRG